MTNKRKYCAYCGEKLSSLKEADVLRDHCAQCNTFFYDNPIPVAANILMRDHEILLVKRKINPFKGYWCLPMGFAETGESIEESALRELEEETGIKGKILSLVNVESGLSKSHGDLLYLTYETEWVSGRLIAGDDAEEVGFFTFDNMPEMAFRSNIHAIEKFISSGSEYESMLFPFYRSVGMRL